MADFDTDQLPRRRGRPKGTGIDDSTLIARIVGLMGADKSLKPTTAIKQCGIDNPSIVRRLREKLKTAPAKATAVHPAPITDPPPDRRQIKTTARRSRPTHKPARQAAATGRTRFGHDRKHAPDPQTGAVPAATKSDSERAREAALLAAYLKALQATAVPALDDEPTVPLTASVRPIESPSDEPPQPRAPAETPHPTSHIAQPKAPLGNPFAGFQYPAASQPAGMSFPFMPPFLQPFLPKPPPPNPAMQQHMEALKLSVEVMTAVTKLQMLAYQNTLAATPMGTMLQAQVMMGQLLLASFSGFTVGPRKPSDGK